MTSPNFRWTQRLWTTRTRTSDEEDQDVEDKDELHEKPRQPVPTTLRLYGELKHMTECLGTYLLAPQRTAHGKPVWEHETEDRLIG
jgi:hypothetical protein